MKKLIGRFIFVEVLRKRTRWMLMCLLLTFMFSACKQVKPVGVLIGEVDAANPALTTITVSQGEARLLMEQFNRLVHPHYYCTYGSAKIVSFPQHPGQYTHYLMVEAEITLQNLDPVFTSYKVYSELTQNGQELVFHTNNFQQSCTSKSCTDCNLVMYQNGTFGCECSGGQLEHSLECEYEKNRVLTKKQQKSDII